MYSFKRKKKKIQDYLLEHLIDFGKDSNSEKLIINTKNIEMDMIKLYLHHIDTIIFKLLLNFLKEDMELYTELEKSIKQASFYKITEEPEWYNKKWSLYEWKLLKKKKQKMLN